MKNLLVKQYIRNNIQEIKNLVEFFYISNLFQIKQQDISFILAEHIHLNILHDGFFNFKNSDLVSVISDIQQSFLNSGFIFKNDLDYPFITLKNEPLTDFLKKITYSLINDNEPQIVLNPYYINNGFCYEIAEDLADFNDDQICTILMIENDVLFRNKMLKKTSPYLNLEILLKIICKANHEWVYDEENDLFFDAEVPFGVKFLDDIPIFSRAIARSVLFENTNIGGKWSKNYSQFVIDRTIPFIIDNIENNITNKTLVEESINHALNKIDYCSNNIKLIFEKKLKKILK